MQLVNLRQQVQTLQNVAPPPSPGAFTSSKLKRTVAYQDPHPLSVASEDKTWPCEAAVLVLDHDATHSCQSAPEGIAGIWNVESRCFQDQRILLIMQREEAPNLATR